ncbi:hypothetical protein G7Y79_00011g030550 [Physcia stellaris]|nr:hypothetical protein G7Y79_00011g030550 [Physcia stellaris]
MAADLACTYGAFVEIIGDILSPALFEEQHVAGGEQAAVLALPPWVGVIEADVVDQVGTLVHPAVIEFLIYSPVDLGLKGWLDDPPLPSDVPQIACL